MRTQSRLVRLFPLSIAALSLLFSLSAPTSVSAVAMWSRRYGVPCGYCHAYPSLQLNAEGADFLRRGHRIKGDSFDKDLSHMISVHGEWDWDVVQGQPTTFQTPTFHIHAGGALSKFFSAYVDATINEELEAAYIQYTKEHGTDTYFTARAGKVNPTLIRDYANGIMASASKPLIITTTLGANPFTPARDSFGVDVAARWKSIFVQTGVVNGEDVEGQASVNNHKDFYATGEFALPDGLSGVGLYYYRGGYDIGDPAATTIFYRYNRQGVFANFTREKFRLAGAYIYGANQVSTLPDSKLDGYYIQSDFAAADWVVPFLRWDDVTTTVIDERSRTQKATVGLAIKLYESQWTAGRIVLEGSRQKEGGVYTTAGLFNILWIY